LNFTNPTRCPNMSTLWSKKNMATRHIIIDKWHCCGSRMSTISLNHTRIS
jgi:hypothetical protein